MDRYILSWNLWSTSTPGLSMFTAPLPHRLMDDKGPVGTSSFVDPWTVLSLKLSFGSLYVSLYTRLFTEFLYQNLWTRIWDACK